MKTTFYTFLLIALSLNIFGQNAQDYIIYHNGDTVFGQIDFSASKKDYLECKFAENGSDLYKTYTAKDLQAYKITGGGLYIAHEVLPGHYKFLEIYVKSIVNIYTYRDKSGEHILLEKPGVAPLKEVPEIKETMDNSGGVATVSTSTEHIGFLKYYFNDCPAIYDKIDHIGTPGKRSIKKLIEAYCEECHSDQTVQSFKYKKENRVLTEIAFSTTKYRQNSMPYFGGGFIAHFNIKYFSQNTYLRTGVQMNRINDGVEKFTNWVNIWDMVRVPIQFEYVYQKHKIQPYAALGVDLMYTIENYLPFSYEAVFLDPADSTGNTTTTETLYVPEGLRKELTLMGSLSFGARYLLNDNWYLGLSCDITHIPFKKDVMREENPIERKQIEALQSAIQTYMFYIGYRF
ncbi:MAG: hypothetical protein MI922_29360 [Bacteroidales bacterium]|nr:hypothetical protein [Bacteroidales bacterium]